MASITTTSSTVDITLINSEMGETVFKINNPVSGLTLSKIRDVYKNMLGNSDNPAQAASAENSHLFDRNGKPLVLATKAVRVQTTTTATEVE